MRITSLLSIVSAVGIALVSAEARAEGLDDKKIVLGGDLQFVLPVGDMADVTGPQIGPLVRGGYRVTPALEVTGRLGYLFGINKSTTASAGTTSVTLNTNISNVPLWLGARYYFMNAPAGAYGDAELAFNFMSLNASLSGGGISVPGASRGFTRVGFNLGGGYVISPELPIDIRAQLSLFNLLGTDSGEKTFIGIGLSAGYSFFL
jgi:hypothetical protein